MRGLLTRADLETLESRPTRAWLAEFTGLCERSITNYNNLAEDLGYITVTEEGTTERIRAGRCYPNPDPHAGEGNHAKVYQLHIPEQLRAQIIEPYDGQEGVQQPRVPAGHRRTCAPSTGTCSTRGKDLSTPVGPTATRTRARIEHHQPHTVKPEKRKTPHPRRPASRGLWLERIDDVQAVWQTLPTALTEQLADHEAPRIADAIAQELTHRTPDQLTERITRHWAYWRYKLAAGLVRSPAAIAFRLIRRDFDCPDVRCEDRWQLDLDDDCKACELRAEEIRRERLAARTATQRPRYSVPFKPSRPCPVVWSRPIARPGFPPPAEAPVGRPERCDPNEEFKNALAALKRRHGAAAVQARSTRRATA
jgi:hypothetical protein